MELIGIISEHSPELSKKKFDDFKIELEYDNKKEILNYLNNGIPVAVTMQIVYSLIKDDSNIIGGISYLTDGYWIWPNYLNYYVDKVSIELPERFVDFIFKNKISELISEEQKREAINLLKAGK